jgi:hypothetical protein
MLQDIFNFTVILESSQASLTSPSDEKILKSMVNMENLCGKYWQDRTELLKENLF